MGIKNFIKKGMVKLKEMLFPENFTCIICDKELNEDKMYCTCDECLEKIDFIGERACEKCGSKVLADSRVCTDCKREQRIIVKNYSAIVFKDDIRKVIHDFKYANKRYLKKPLGKILYHKYEEVLKDYVPDIIIPIPLHKNRRNERGYNQVELMLGQFEKDLDKMNFDCVVRTKNTPNQASMTREDRQLNVHKAFEIVDKKVLKGKKILLVDDVFTSGATIDECARIMLKVGASEVRSMTLAHSHEEKPILEENKTAL